MRVLAYFIYDRFMFLKNWNRLVKLFCDLRFFDALSHVEFSPSMEHKKKIIEMNLKIFFASNNWVIVNFHFMSDEPD